MSKLNDWEYKGFTIKAAGDAKRVNWHWKRHYFNSKKDAKQFFDRILKERAEKNGTK